MDIFQPDLISKTIPWLISLAGMTLFALFIFYDDLKKMKIVAWKLLSFIGIGFLAFYISHIIYGDFQWYYLIPLPLFVLIYVLNTLFNNNKFLGKADVDILSGSISLLTVVAISILSVNYDNTMVNSIHLMDMINQSLIYLLMGYILAILFFIGNKIIIYVRKKMGKEIKEDSNVRLLKAKAPIAIAFMPLYFYSVYLSIFI